MRYIDREEKDISIPNNQSSNWLRNSLSRQLCLFLVPGWHNIVHPNNTLLAVLFSSGQKAFLEWLEMLHDWNSHINRDTRGVRLVGKRREGSDRRGRRKRRTRR